MSSDTSRDLPPPLPAIPRPAAHRPAAGWREAAACRQADPELFFPIASAGQAAAEIQQAKAVCASCPVRRPCLTYALATAQEFGIWGGRDENERRLLRRQQREFGTAAGAKCLQPGPGPCCPRESGPAAGTPRPPGSAHTCCPANHQ